MTPLPGAPQQPRGEYSAGAVRLFGSMCRADARALRPDEMRSPDAQTASDADPPAPSCRPQPGCRSHLERPIPAGPLSRSGLRGQPRSRVPGEVPPPDADNGPATQGCRGGARLASNAAYRETRKVSGRSGRRGLNPQPSAWGVAKRGRGAAEFRGASIRCPLICAANSPGGPTASPCGGRPPPGWGPCQRCGHGLT
jgi:hypothetical protein